MPDSAPKTTKDATREKIEELKNRLYQNDFQAVDIPLASFGKQEESATSREWETPLPKLSPHLPPSPTHNAMWKKIIIGSVFFFVLATVFAVMSFRGGGNTVSAEQVSIAIDAPTFAEGGEEVSVRLTIKNNNDTAIESADLVIVYPEGAYAPNAKEALVRDTDALGSIPAGGTVEKNVTVILFGQEGVSKVIEASMEFRFADTSAVLKKTAVHSISISSSPLDLSLQIPKEVGIGQEFDFTIRVVSASERVINSLLVTVEYPLGFSVISKTPETIPGENAWNIGDLAPGATRTITVRGKMEGVADEERVFRVSAGTARAESAELEVAYSSLTETVTIKKPFLSLSVSLNGEKGTEVVSGAEKMVRADILWENTLPTRLLETSIEVVLSGTALDRLSVIPGQGGFFRSVDNTIVWTPSENGDLTSIEPGARGSVSFSFESLPLVDKAGKVLKNPQITMVVSAKGKRASGGMSSEEVFVRETRTVKIESDIRLLARSLYFQGPFKNTGPLPPKVEQETTYTVVWTITNSSNNVSDAIVRAVLPPYVKWLGVVSPAGERVSWNASGGEVVWNAGSVSAGAGFTGKSREVAFQISLLPSVSQVGRSVVLVRESFLSGRDTFTRTELSDKALSQTTFLSTDPLFKQEYGSVSQ